MKIYLNIAVAERTVCLRCFIMKLLIDFLKFSFICVIALVIFLGVIQYGPSLRGFSPLQKTLIFSIIVLALGLGLEIYTSGTSGLIAGLKGIFLNKVSWVTWGWRISGLIMGLIGFILTIGGAFHQLAFNPILGKLFMVGGFLVLMLKGKDPRV